MININKMKTNLEKLKDYTGTIEYHLEVCDCPVSECPIKQEEWKKNPYLYIDENES